MEDRKRENSTQKSYRNPELHLLKWFVQVRFFRMLIFFFKLKISSYLDNVFLCISIPHSELV